MRIIDAFPEAQTLTPPLPAEQVSKMDVLKTARRQQLVDFAMAYGVEDRINRDGTKEAILLQLTAMEHEGFFNKPCRRPWYLMRAARTADEWRDFKTSGQKVPTMDSMPDRERTLTLDPESMPALYIRAKELGIATFGVSKIKLQALISEAELRALQR